MCNRYRRTTQEEELGRLYRVPIPADPQLPISWNIAPGQDVLAIRLRSGGSERRLSPLRWGLIPSWAKDRKIANKTKNARAETVDTAPSFRSAFQKRRCLLVADGFYEWRTQGGPKMPFSIQLKSSEPFCFAGLWEPWKDPTSDEWLRTCTIITTEPNEMLAEIHDRMPVIIPVNHHEAWLNGSAGKEILVPYPAELMEMYEISTLVNSPANNDARILEPIRHDVASAQLEMALETKLPKRPR
jgi:putative SOS response-associated peptidase YedK